jgi:hypothetical protein
VVAGGVGLVAAADDTAVARADGDGDALGTTEADGAGEMEALGAADGEIDGSSVTIGVGVGPGVNSPPYPNKAA